MATTPTPVVSNVSAVSSIITDITGVAGGILSAVSVADPGLALPAEVIAEIGKLATMALSAWTTASGQTINVDSVQALLPNPTPLTAPTS